MNFTRDELSEAFKAGFDFRADMLNNPSNSEYIEEVFRNKKEQIQKNAMIVTLLSNNNPLFILTFDENRKVSDEQIIDGVRRFYKMMSYDVDVELTKSVAHFTDIIVRNFPESGDVLRLGWTIISNVPV